VWLTLTWASAPLVFEAIRERHRYTHPDLVHPTKAIGDLLTGDDNALESVAIWRGVEADAHSIAVYVAGLCGEARQMKNPIFDPARPEGPKIRNNSPCARRWKSVIIYRVMRLPGLWWSRNGWASVG